jgi:hypothetical protein
MPGVHTASAGSVSEPDPDEDAELLAQPDVARRIAPIKAAHVG